MTLRPTSALALALLSVPAAAQFDITPLVLEGDPVAGVGNVTRIDNLVVNDNLDWLVEADTDHANTDADQVLLRNGTLYLREGDALSQPTGATLATFDAINLNSGMHSGWNFFLDGTTGGNDDSGVYFDTQLLFQEGSVTGAPELTAGTPYAGFLESKINGAGNILLLATVNDPNLSAGVDQVLLELTLDGTGALVSTSALFKRDDVLPGQSAALLTFATGPHNFDYNDAGDVMFFGDMSDGNDVIYVNDTLVAQVGGPSPLGPNWLALSTPELSLNASGSYAFTGRADTGDTANDTLMIEDGAVFVREGDSLPAFAPFRLTSFGSGPVDLGDDGRILWFGDWNDPDTTRDTGLFLDDELLVQEGVTTIGGLLVDELRGIQDGYMRSAKGRYILFEALLEGGVEGVFLITEAASVTPIASCAGNAGVLTHTGGDGSIGASVDFSLDGAQANPSLPVLSFSLDPAPGFPPCGFFVPGIGELLIGFLPPDPILDFFGALWIGAPVAFSLFIPPDPSLVGIDLWAQGSFFDFSGLTAEPFRMTDGARIVIGL